MEQSVGIRNKSEVKRQLFQAAAIVAGGTIASKLLGFIPEMALAAKFGATMFTDTYLVASLIPVMLFSVLGASLSTTFIPVLSEYPANRGRPAALRLGNNLLNIILMLCLVLTILGELFSSQIVRVRVSGVSRLNIHYGRRPHASYAPGGSLLRVERGSYRDSTSDGPFHYACSGRTPVQSRDLASAHLLHSPEIRLVMEALRAGWVKTLGMGRGEEAGS